MKGDNSIGAFLFSVLLWSIQWIEQIHIIFKLGSTIMAIVVSIYLAKLYYGKWKCSQVDRKKKEIELKQKEAEYHKYLKDNKLIE